jgi:hypothetical protein
MKVIWDDEIPNIWENKIHYPNHQSVIYYIIYFGETWEPLLNETNTWCRKCLGRFRRFQELKAISRSILTHALVVSPRIWGIHGINVASLRISQCHVRFFHMAYAPCMWRICKKMN